MRAVALTTANGGINRDRIKGGANPDNLYDLINGYVEQDGSITGRPGSTWVHTLSTNTKGLCAYQGKLWAFSHLTITPSDPNFKVATITDPDNPSSAIKTIHFAAPYLGYLYVVAEFMSGNTLHYWLYVTDTWAPKTRYDLGATIQPTVDNGYYYRAHRATDPYPVWEAGVARQDATPGPASIVEPTTFNGFAYTCQSTTGTSPRSGDTEPVWPAFAYGNVTEYSDLVTPAGTTETGDTTPTEGGSQPAPTPIRERYGVRIFFDEP